MPMAKSTCCCTLAVALLATFARAGVPVVWTTDTFKVKPLAYECYHGETLDLAASLTSYGEPLALSGKTAKLFWQTPDMGETWYETNATIRADAETGATNVLAATFSGAYDTGKERVNGFIGVVGENYRAAFELKFRASPGFVPHELPLPAKTIDCAKVTFLNPTNAPWATGGGGGECHVTDVLTNGVSAVAGKVARITIPSTNGLATTSYADAKAAAATNALPAWTKTENKPTYTASDVGAFPAMYDEDSGRYLTSASIEFTEGLLMVDSIGAHSLNPTITGAFSVDVGSRAEGNENAIATLGDITAENAGAVQSICPEEGIRSELIWGDTMGLVIAGYAEGQPELWGAELSFGYGEEVKRWTATDFSWIKYDNSGDDVTLQDALDDLAPKSMISATNATFKTATTNVVANSDNLWNASNVKLTTRINEVSAPISTNAAEAVVGEVLDYALTNLTGSAIILASGCIGNITMAANTSVTLDFSSAANRSGDCLLYAINATANDYTITPQPTAQYAFVSADLAKALTIGKATTNILSFTRLKADTVLVSKLEVK